MPGLSLGPEAIRDQMKKDLLTMLRMTTSASSLKHTKSMVEVMPMSSVYRELR